MSDHVSSPLRSISPRYEPVLKRDDYPATVVVSGGRPGVGATTLAVHLATILAQEAHRIVLIDADLYGADIAARCHLAGMRGIGDVLFGRKSIHEVLERGPAGIQVLAGAASPETRGGLSERSIQRLLKQMRSLAPHADWLIVDAGNQPSDFTARIWAEADALLLVTSPDAVAVMDTYALVKTLLSRQSLRRPLWLAVNQAADAVAAADVHRRVDQSCRRFLGLSVEFAGWLPCESCTERQGMTEALTIALSQMATHVFGSHHAQVQRRAA